MISRMKGCFEIGCLRLEGIEVTAKRPLRMICPMMFLQVHKRGQALLEVEGCGG